MKYPILSIIGVLLITIMLLTACKQIQNVSLGECIPASSKWEFQVRSTMTTETMKAEEKKIPPSGEWKVEATLPDEGSIHSLVTHSSDEIWALTDNAILKYSPVTSSWKTYRKVSGSDIIPDGLFVSRNGTLWGIDINYLNDDLFGQEFPLLSRYDEATDQFQFVKDQDNALHDHMIASHPSQIKEDQKGLLWMILDENGLSRKGTITALYSFDPVTLQARRQISASDGSFFSDIAIAPDGNIWIADSEMGRLIIYDPVTKGTDIYSGDPPALDDIANENLRGVANLYFDRSGRLWVEDRGWLDFSSPDLPSWHMIIRSPVFITDSSSPENQFAWYRPYQTYESSNGLYWFTGGGLVRLNPSTGEWCRFTTGESPVVEDHHNNIWIIIYGKLYKYHFIP